MSFRYIVTIAATKLPRNFDFGGSSYHMLD